MTDLVDVQPDAADPNTGEALEAPTTSETDSPATSTPQQADDASETPTEAAAGDGDVFPRAYVEQLRREAANYRDKAKTAEKQAEDANVYLDGLMRRLHTELVRATGKLADPADLDFDTAHLFDTDALNTAIDELLTAKPHLRARKPVGDVGQGNRGETGTFSLLDVLKSRA